MFLLKYHFSVNLRLGCWNYWESGWVKLGRSGHADKRTSGQADKRAVEIDEKGQDAMLVSREFLSTFIDEFLSHEDFAVPVDFAYSHSYIDGVRWFVQFTAICLSSNDASQTL
jgi:hypothetical protein